MLILRILSQMNIFSSVYKIIILQFKTRRVEHIGKTRNMYRTVNQTESITFHIFCLWLFFIKIHLGLHKQKLLAKTNFNFLSVFVHILNLEQNPDKEC